MAEGAKERMSEPRERAEGAKERWVERVMGRAMQMGCEQMVRRDGLMLSGVLVEIAKAHDGKVSGSLCVLRWVFDLGKYFC